MAATSVTTTINLEIEVEIEGVYHPGTPDIVSGGPDNWEQGTPDTAEIEAVYAVYPASRNYTGESAYRSIIYRYPKISIEVLEALYPGFLEEAQEALIAEANIEWDEN